MGRKAVEHKHAASPVEVDVPSNESLGHASSDGYQELSDFLASDRAPSAMPPVVLDGYLTGLVVAPRMISPSVWLDEIWGGEAPKFADIEEANRIVGAIVAEYNTIIEALTPALGGDPAALELPFAIDDVEQADLWSKGFMAAVAVDGRAWKPVVASDELCLMLAPMMILAAPDSEFAEALFEDGIDLNDAKRDSIRMLTKSVCALFMSRQANDARAADRASRRSPRKRAGAAARPVASAARGKKAIH